MNTSAFSLHPRLDADTDWIGDLPLCRVLLHKENIGPWLILVPRYEALREIHHMGEDDQIRFIKESSFVAGLLETAFNPEKINVGALGNMVPQLHVHHIARFSNDIAWPGPVWGNTDGTLRNKDEQEALVALFRKMLKTL